MLIKTLVAVLATALVLTAILHVLLSTIVLDSASKLENASVLHNVSNVQTALANQLQVLNSRAADWAHWDDTYQFIQDQNPQYRQNNLVESSFQDLGIDFMIFVNDEGYPVVDSGFYLENESSIEVPQSLLSRVTRNSQLNFQNVNDNLTGFLLIPESPVMFAAQAITTSLLEGPIRGCLFLARYVDAQEIGNLAASVHLPLTLTLYSEWQTLNDASSDSHFAVKPLNTSMIAGYCIVEDTSNQPIFVVGATMPRDVFKADQTLLLYTDLSVLGVGVVFYVTLMLLFEKVVLSRVSKLTKAVVEVSKNRDFSASVKVSGRDELSSLSSSINDMLRELERKSMELRKAERLSTIGELSAIVAHDLRNPLQGIANAVYFLKTSIDPADAEKKEMIDEIETEIGYSTKIINDLLDYAKDLRLDLTEVSPQALVKSALLMMLIPENVVVKNDVAAEPTFKGDFDKLKRAFGNIIKNAMDAMPNGGTLTISAKLNGGKMHFVFADTGVGISKEAQQKLFAPMFTTKSKGMGFGLAITKKIVDAHKGTISVESVEGSGTTFTIELPPVG